MFSIGILAETLAGTNEYAGCLWTVVLQFGCPFVANVCQRRGRRYREADQKDIGLWIRQRTKSIKVFHTGSVPELNVQVLFIDTAAKLDSGLGHEFQLRQPQGR